MSYRESAIILIEDIDVAGVKFERRVKMVTYLRKKDCKCGVNPYQNGCAYCSEIIEPLVCEKCGNYYCKCKETEDVFIANPKCTF